jgi:hypothetical protein
MAVFLSIWGPKEFSSTFWLGIVGWAAGFIGNGKSIHDAHTSLAPVYRLGADGSLPRRDTQ